MHRQIGLTGIQVYPIGFGALHLSTTGRPDEETAIGVIKAALDAGVTLIDTADSYCQNDGDFNHNEKLIAKALKRLGAKGRVTVATKGGMTRPGGAWHTDGRPERLIACCEASLRALEVDCIDLYQLHWPDPDVPYMESVGALVQLQEQGKIRHIGISNVNDALLETAQHVAQVASVQNRFNLEDQVDLSNGFIGRCARERIAYLPYAPVGGGSGHRAMSRNADLTDLAAKYGVSPYRVTLAWMLALGQNVLPIPGASKAASIQDSAAATGLTLEEEDVARLCDL